MPTLRGFRALRYDVASVDLSAVLCPPYDIIAPQQREALLARDPHNAVRLELPADLGVAEAAAYLGAARTLDEWRAERVLVRDQAPTITLHRMTWPGPGGAARSATGVFARLRLEAFGPGSGVRPHERTLSGPREDRYQLLRATGLNSSPIVLLAGSDPAPAGRLLSELTAGPATATATTGDGVVHDLWILASDDPADPRPAALLDSLASAPLTIADGHHRYETALRYREELGRDGASGSDPASDYVLALVYPLEGSPPALPTHRVVRGKPCGAELIARLAQLADVEPLAGGEALMARMEGPVDHLPGATGSGLIGLYTTDGRAALLSVAGHPRLDALLEPGLSDASRGLDVHRLAALIEHAYGETSEVRAGDGRLRFVKDAARAMRSIDEREASGCYLLHPVPAGAIVTVAAAGEVMPQKSTYFDPKAPAGLLFSSMEW